MKKKISRLICAVACCVPVALQAQTSEKITSPVNLYKEGKELFLQKNYAAAMPPLRTFVRQKADVNLKEEAEYMLVCSAYELKDRNAIAQLRNYLDTYPDTPHANRIYALIASAYFYQGNYDEALALFNSSRLDLLGNEERDDMTYQLATCYLKVGNVKEAAIWFETLKASSPKYSYYISYIRYTQKRYDEALKGFLPLQDDAKYKALVPYYIAEIYAVKKNYDKAQIVAQNYLSAYPQNEHAAIHFRGFWEMPIIILEIITRRSPLSGIIWKRKILHEETHFICWDCLTFRPAYFPKLPKHSERSLPRAMHSLKTHTCTWDSPICIWLKKTKPAWHSSRLPPRTQT